MAKEKIFENKIREYLNSLDNCWHFKHWAGAMSKKGVPDLLGCYKGRFLGIEVKGEGGKPSPLQVRNVDLIRKAGGYADIVFPKDFEKMKNDIQLTCNNHINKSKLISYLIYNKNVNSKMLITMIERGELD